MSARTVLHSQHVARGARMIEFGGWEMPVFYTSIADEHRTVRRAAGLFDIAHMGEIFVNGPGAAAFLRHALTSDPAALPKGRGQYACLCRPDGGTIDDLYVYRLDDARFLMIVKAARVAADWAWLTELQAAWRGEEAKLENASDRCAALALQGPKSEAIAEAFFPASAMKKNDIVSFSYRGVEVWAGRTGYTGESGFEFALPQDRAEALWDDLLVAGHPHCLQPAGLGARDTLRLEAGYPLYGHELNEDTSPIEAGLSFAVALDKGDFVGGDALRAQKAAGPSRRLIAFAMEGKGPPPREGYPLWLAGEAAPLGRVTSGSVSPTLGGAIGMGFVRAGAVKAGDSIEIEVRGRRFPATVRRRPLYRSPTPS